MDRLNIDQNKAVAMHDYCADLYPGYEQPCPGTALKLYDDVLWLDLFSMRVIHGHDHVDYFNALCPDLAGDEPSQYLNCDAHYITDRAPLDPQETPMPIYPEQQQMRAASTQQQQSDVSGHRDRDAKKALQHVLKQLQPEQAKKVRALVKEKRPELLTGAGSDIGP